MQDFLIGLALLTIGALAATALNHPDRFSRIYKIFGGFMLSGCLFAWGHEVGFVRATQTVMTFVPANRANEARVAIENVGLPTWGGPATFVFALFMVALLFAHPILGISKDGRKDRDGHDEPKPPPAA